MAKLTETEFLKKVITLLQEVNKKNLYLLELQEDIRKVNHYIQGRIDTLPE